MKKPYVVITEVIPTKKDTEIWHVDYPNRKNKEDWLCYRVEDKNGRETWMCELLKEMK